MKKTWIISKTEFINTLTRRSFLLTLILVPLVPAILLGVISLFGQDVSPGSWGDMFQPSPDPLQREGFIDQANIIKEIPDWIDENRLVAYQSFTAAEEDTRSGKILGFYVIQEDYLVTGNMLYVRADFNPMASIEMTGSIEAVIQYNLLGADQRLFDLYSNPLQVKPIDLSPSETGRDVTNPLAFYLPYGVTLLFYFLIVNSASLMMQSVAKEKENRVMEVLLSSVKPRQLLTGKILGLGGVGLLQMIIWTGAALLMLHLGASTLHIPPNLQLPPEIFSWGILFFILGYLIYATIMAGVGALVSNLKEATQATIYIILPILVPLLLLSVIIEQPHATLPVILSLIPFTAPNTLMTRLAVTSVPIWQLLLSILFSILTFILLIRAVAGMFRTQILLTGQKFSPGVYLRVLLGKEHG